MEWEVRRIRPGEGDRLREIRLHALSESPSAFGSTFATESVRSDSSWREIALARSQGDMAATFVAEASAGWVGLAGGFREPGERQTVELVSMWVAPEARGSGVGRSLVEKVVAWARATGAERVQLWVTRGNEPAATLYRRAGFMVTDDYQPLPSDPCQEEQRMELVLDGPAAG